MTRSTVIRSALLVFTLFAAGTGLGGRAIVGTVEAADGARYVLGIEGMSCAEACPPQVQSSLQSIEGVKSVEISFEDKRAVVQMSPGYELTKEVCDKSFHNKGYFVSSFTREDAAAMAPGTAAAN